MFVRPQGGEGSSSVRMVDATSIPSIPSLNGPLTNAQFWRYIDFGSNKEILPILGSLIAVARILGSRFFLISGGGGWKGVVLFSLARDIE